MTKGIFKSILYYLVGLGLAALSYSAIGHGYNHAPGLHHMIILLTFIGGLLWLIAAGIKYFTEQRTETLKGIVFTNLFMILSFVLFMIYIITDSADNREFENKAGEVTIEQSGDTTTIRL